MDLVGCGVGAHTGPFGVVTAPSQRYHPVVHAQAMATVASMFPGRLTISLGSGEATNEHVTGEPLASETRAQRTPVLAFVG